MYVYRNICILASSSFLKSFIETKPAWKRCSQRKISAMTESVGAGVCATRRQALDATPLLKRAFDTQPWAPSS